MFGAHHHGMVAVESVTANSVTVDKVIVTNAPVQPSTE